MSNFYLSDPNIVINGNLKPLEFRIYSYCCSQFNVKKMSAFIRIVNIGGQFQKTKEEVEEILISLSKIKINDKPVLEHNLEMCKKGYAVAYYGQNKKLVEGQHIKNRKKVM